MKIGKDLEQESRGKVSVATKMIKMQDVQSLTNTCAPTGWKRKMILSSSLSYTMLSVRLITKVASAVGLKMLSNVEYRRILVRLFLSESMASWNQEQQITTSKERLALGI